MALCDGSVCTGDSYLPGFGFGRDPYHVDLCSIMRLGRQHSASTDTVVIVEESRRAVMA
jgi:hypothetical protein